MTEHRARLGSFEIHDQLGQIATWKREAPLANPGTTHQFEWTLALDYSGQLTSAIEKDLSGGLRD